MSMNIVLFGKRFYEKHKESVKHVVEEFLKLIRAHCCLMALEQCSISTYKMYLRAWDAFQKQKI